MELCGPGIYRVFALDQLGDLLAEEPIARWDLSVPARDQPRNAAMDPMVALRHERPVTASVASPTTDLRFALETMAQMMRTHSDALRIVAASQVDLAKTIATVKGLPRNAAMYLPPTPPANDTDDDDDDDSDEDEVEEAHQVAAPTNFLDLLRPFSEAIAPKVADYVPGLLASAAAMTSPTSNTATASPSTNEDLASRPFEMRELVDLNYAHKKAKAKQAAARPQPPQRPAVAAPLQARVMRDPQLVQQIIAIKSALAPDEIETLLSSVGRLPEAAQTKFLETIKPLSVDDAVAYCREVIKNIRARHAGSGEIESDDERAVANGPQG